MKVKKKIKCCEYGPRCSTPVSFGLTKKHSTLVEKAFQRQTLLYFSPETKGKLFSLFMSLLQLARVLVPGKPLRSSLMFLGRVMSLPYEGAPNKQASASLIYNKLGCKCSPGTNTLAYFASVTK